MLTDDVTIRVSAGKGGDGAVNFSRIVMNQGPTGGNGGKGGNIIIKGVTDIGALRPYRTRKKIVAGNGQRGGQNMRTGADGKDNTVIVPIGTVVHDLTNQKDYEIVNAKDKLIIARGGNGGFGNFYYRSSINTTPKRANPGEKGEDVEIRLELKLIADIGFVGYPNVGKSTLLNELTNASSKVANYKFTTLEPHLGVYYELILADIPGIIEGASEGKGLGHKFLKHIERTKILFHFVAADSEDPLGDYKAIRKELKKYNPVLLKKDEWIIISRADERKPEEVEKIVSKLKKKNSQIISLTVLDEASIGGVKKVLNKIKDDK